MKIVNIRGGLGNQMFQYAFALALRNKFPDEEILIDIQHYNYIWLKKYKSINLHNGFEIDKFFPAAPLKPANFKDLIKISYYIPNYFLSRIGRKILPVRKTEYVAPKAFNHCFDLDAFNRKGDCYYEGYWQCPNYFASIKPLLIEIFKHPEPNKYNAELIKEILSTNSVGIHVRRGDYLKSEDFKGLCGVEYYKKAIREVLKRVKDPVFYVFSNDIKWCEDFLTPLFKGNKYVFITDNKGEDSIWDMFLMTYCKYLIIANSSFSWWGAFLNKNKLQVYAPSPWINRKANIDIYEPDWVKIKSN